MAKDWDFYLCRVDDKPASIFLDLALARDAPIGDLPHMAYVFVSMNAPRPDGLSSKEEFDTLAAIEDALEQGLCTDFSTRYVGRNTSAGRRDFFYYTGRESGWKDRVAAVMRSFPAYDVDYGARSDPEWETYFRFLYPVPADHQRIMNRRVCFNLEKHGRCPGEAARDRPLGLFPQRRSARRLRGTGCRAWLRMARRPKRREGRGGLRRSPHARRRAELSGDRCRHYATVRPRSRVWRTLQRLGMRRGLLTAGLR
jgi:hypothetical protein